MGWFEISSIRGKNFVKSNRTSQKIVVIQGSGTPRPKTISARDSSAQIDFFTGTPRPGTLRPSIKYFICGIQWKTNVYLVCFYLNKRFSTIGKRNVKKESIFSYKQM